MLDFSSDSTIIDNTETIKYYVYGNNSYTNLTAARLEGGVFEKKPSSGVYRENHVEFQFTNNTFTPQIKDYVVDSNGDTYIVRRVKNQDVLNAWKAIKCFKLDFRSGLTSTLTIYRPSLVLDSYGSQVRTDGTLVGLSAVIQPLQNEERETIGRQGAARKFVIYVAYDYDYHWGDYCSDGTTTYKITDVQNRKILDDISEIYCEVQQ